MNTMNGSAVYVDPLVRRAQKRDETEMGRRKRVCSACVKDSDHELGLIYSRLPCERCGASWYHGKVVSLS
jgi:uncharacterized paraquat-inducible protein A